MIGYSKKIRAGMVAKKKTYARQTETPEECRPNFLFQTPIRNLFGIGK